MFFMYHSECVKGAGFLNLRKNRISYNRSLTSSGILELRQTVKEYYNLVREGGCEYIYVIILNSKLRGVRYGG